MRLVWLMCISIWLCWNVSAVDAAPPNIVLFLADDLGWADCSINNPNSGIRTPNMERVTKAGMTFSHAFVASPSCAPSRAALLTGLHPVRNGAMFNHTLPDQTHKRWPAWFQELGYEVAAIGKVAHYATVQQYGFDHVSHFNYHQDDCITAAIAWLEKRKSDKPLCFLVGTNWPHVPWPEQTSFTDDLPLPAKHIDTPETRRWRARYAQAVSHADRDLGLVFDAIQNRLGANTLWLFTSDHGAQWPFGKWNCYDAGIRTPLVAVWPGQIPPGSRTDAIVSWTDILPTCLEAAGSTPPPTGTERGTLSGRSFMNVMRGTATAHHARIVATHSGDGDKNNYPIRAIRSRDWKYIRNLLPDAKFTSHIDKVPPADGRGYWESWREKAESDPLADVIVRRYHTRPAEELYDLAADPHEEHNLASDPKHAERLAEFRTELDTWMKQHGDRGLDTENARRPPSANKTSK